jgi:hypothetical protein
LSHIALKEPNPIWRYEALIALSRPIHEAPLSNRAADSRRELQMLSEEGGPGVKALARQMLGEASSVSEP